jgi:hypothetical protein
MAAIKMFIHSDDSTTQDYTCCTALDGFISKNCKIHKACHENIREFIHLENQFFALRF